MTPYHTNRCFSFNAAKDCRRADYKAVWLSFSTKVSLHNFECIHSSSEVTYYITLFQSDSESDQSTDSLPTSPKQPCIEQEPEVLVVNIDVAYLAKRRSSLTEHEKYNFYCYHFTPDIDYKFHVKVVMAFYISIWESIVGWLQLVRKIYEVCDLHAAREYHKDAIAVCDAS